MPSSSVREQSLLLTFFIKLLKASVGYDILNETDLAQRAQVRLDNFACLTLRDPMKCNKHDQLAGFGNSKLQTI